MVATMRLGKASRYALSQACMQNLSSKYWQPSLLRQVLTDRPSHVDNVQHFTTLWLLQLLSPSRSGKQGSSFAPHCMKTPAAAAWKSLEGQGSVHRKANSKRA
eukprot:scaffold75174_cov19-Tisochrysis_lutea.AAC.1